MHRIDTSTAQKDKFGAGKNGFTLGNAQTGVPPTEVSADILDAMQEEICAVIEDTDSGATLDKSKNNQLLTAIKSIIRSVGMLATEAARGVVKIASQSQTNSGTADDVVITPKKLRAGFSALLAANGYISLPTWMGGFIIQWGIVSGIAAGTTATFTYPLAFPTASLAAFATSGSSTPANCVPFGAGPGVTTCSVTNGGAAVSTAYLLVIGK